MREAGDRPHPNCSLIARVGEKVLPPAPTFKTNAGAFIVRPSITHARVSQDGFHRKPPELQNQIFPITVIDLEGTGEE